MEMQNLKALFLEDSEKDIEIVYQKLSDDFKCPISLDKAQSEACFLHLIRNNQYDVILADYTLPGYNAVSALEQSRKICPATPFICVSGTIGEDLAVEMLKQGAADYVLKDRLERLPFAIRRAIESGLNEQERKKAEQAVKELSESNRLILDSTIDEIGMLDRDGNILNINEKFARRVGKTVEDLIGMNFKTFLTEEKFGDMYQQRLKRLRKAFDSGQPEIFEDSRSGFYFYNRYYPVFKDGQVCAVTLFSTDITDRKKAEEEARQNSELSIEAEMLRRKEIEFLQILDGSTEASWIYDFENGTLEYSAQWLKRIGGENKPAKDMDSYAQSLVHPDDVPRIMKERKTYFDSKSTKYKCEYRIKTVDNEYIWVLEQGKTIYDDSGTPVKVYGTSMDITDRKTAEEALRESENKLRTILDNSRDGINMLDIATGKYIFISPAQVELTGFTKDEINGITAEEAYERIHPDDRELSIKQQQLVISGIDTLHEVEYRWKVKSGEYRWFSDRRKLVRNDKGQPIALVGISRDITDRKHIEEELFVAYRQIQNIIDNTPDIVYAFDLEERFVMANAALAQLFNSTPEQLMGRRRHEFMPKEDADWHEANDRKAIKENTALEFEEFNQLQGRSITWLTKKFPLRDTQGRIYAVAGISADISERKRTEEALQESEKKAHELVAKLEEADKNKNEFLSALSHELRNPLAAIVAGLSLLDLSDDNKQKRKAQDIMQRQLDQLCHLVDDLLDLTRITNNKIELKKERLDIVKLVSSVAEDYTSLFVEKGVRLEAIINKNSIFIDGDSVRLTQIIGNLLHNALKFSEIGGITQVKLCQEINAAAIRVEDDGIGINPEFLPDLFEPFKQADKSLDRRNGGLGLGLSIVKGIAELHGGSVSAASEGLGKGTAFVINLPLCSENLKQDVAE